MNNLFRFNVIKFNWQFGLTLILLFGIPRIILVLEANRTGNYNFTSLIFVVMWLTPFLVLKKDGRNLMGIKKPLRKQWLLYSFLLGIAMCVVVFFLGEYLYQQSTENWFVYISNSYGGIPSDGFTGKVKLIYFALFAIIGMTFSPIGEELLYRGLIHQSFVSRFGEKWASVIDSLAFALVHLAHFGIVFVNGAWQLYGVPALLWMILMFLTSRLFFLCKSKSDSIYGAVLGHAGFNLAMTYFIFYHIL